MSSEPWDLNDLTDIESFRIGKVWPTTGGALDSTAWIEADMAGILRHQLDAPLEPLKAMLPDGTTGTGSLSTLTPPRTFGELLRHPAPPPAWVPWLRCVKDFAKPAMQPAAQSDAPLPRAVAAVIYFAAVVAARVRAGVSISSLNDRSLQQGIRWAMRQPWLDISISDLFREGLAFLLKTKV